MNNSNTPFRQVRRVPWGDTDAAGTLFFAHICRYCMEAIELWFVERTDLDWYRMNADLKVGTPMVRAEVEFISAVTPRDTLSIEVSVQSTGRSSAVFRVTGRVQDTGACCWDGRFTCVFIDTATRGAVSIPPTFRSALERDAALSTSGPVA
jgi:acyl-CoA thioesterase FadM